MRMAEIEVRREETAREVASVNSLPVARIGGRKVEALSEVERMQLCHDFFLTGNLSAIARERGVDYTSLLELCREGWWVEEIKNLTREELAITKVKLGKIAGKCLSQIEDRLENGDEQWKQVSQGEYGLVRVPLSGRDLTAIAATVFSKKREIEEREGAGGVSNEAKRLLDLAAALRAKDISPREISDAEVLDAEVMG